MIVGGIRLLIPTVLTTAARLGKHTIVDVSRSFFPGRIIVTVSVIWSSDPCVSVNEVELYDRWAVISRNAGSRTRRWPDVAEVDVEIVVVNHFVGEMAHGVGELAHGSDLARQANKMEWFSAVGFAGRLWTTHEERNLVAIRIRPKGLTLVAGFQGMGNNSNDCYPVPQQ